MLTKISHKKKSKYSGRRTKKYSGRRTKKYNRKQKGGSGRDYSLKESGLDDKSLARKRSKSTRSTIANALSSLLRGRSKSGSRDINLSPPTTTKEFNNPLNPGLNAAARNTALENLFDDSIILSIFSICCLNSKSS